MQTVSRFESNLLHILRCFLQRSSLEQVRSLVMSPQERPRCLSRTAVNLVQNMLSNGVTSLLAQGGGWRNERFLREDIDKGGRLWQRTPPAQLGLSFSWRSLDFLITVTACDFSQQKWSWKNGEHPLETGDQLLLALALEACRGSSVISQWRSTPPFVTNAMCWLMFPLEMAPALTSHKEAEDAGLQVDFSPWLAPAGSAVLEAWQQKLAARWVELELSKTRIIDAAVMRNLGAAQQMVLDAFRQTMEKHNRLDLARWQLEAAAKLLHGQPAATRWIENLDVAGQRLADRNATYRAALAFVHHICEMDAWRERARSTAFFDEEYAASQLWLRAVEETGAGDFTPHAQQVIRQLEPLMS